MAVFRKKRDSGDRVGKTPTSVRFGTGVGLIPLVSEKSERLRQRGQYAFVVRGALTKVEVKKAIESAYGVHVDGVNSVVLPRKTVRRGRSQGDTKVRCRFIVRLKAGETIDVTKSL